jgi:hypothetical protein
MDRWYRHRLGFRQTLVMIVLLPWGMGIGVPKVIANPSPSTCPTLTARPETSQPLAVKPQKRSSTSRQASPSPPNLWWAQHQYDPFAGRLVEQWQINRDQQSVEVVVNRQLWSSLDYLGRYRWVSQLGSLIRESQYNLRIINAQNKCLAVYVCEFETTPYPCELLIEPFDRQGITPQRNSF